VLKWLAAAAAVLAAAFPLGLILAAGAASGASTVAAADGGPSMLALSSIPPGYLHWYHAGDGRAVAELAVDVAPQATMVPPEQTGPAPATHQKTAAHQKYGEVVPMESEVSRS
jgi:hypothetical protein